MRSSFKEEKMRFIEPSYEVLSKDFEQELVLEKIERAARLCYKSEGFINEGSAARMVKKLIASGHEAMLEHAPSLSVKFIVSRGVTHEIVRHRLFSFAQESTRYVKYGKKGKGMEFIMPPWIGREDKRTLLNKNKNWDFADFELARFSCREPNSIDFFEVCALAENKYEQMLERGAKPQQAREILPTALKAEIIVTGNVREWRHFFLLRCDSSAHPQIREVAIPLYMELESYIPELWRDIRDRISLQI